MRHIYWFQQDLRLQDNPGLSAHAGAEQLLLVFCWPRSRPWCNLTGMGAQRERFLIESVQALRAELAALGQQLLVVFGSPEEEIPRLVRQFQADRIGTALTPGYYERKAREYLSRSLEIPLQVHAGNTLFSAEQLPFSLDKLPMHFTPFRNRVEHLRSASPLAPPVALPPPPLMDFNELPQPSVAPPIALPLTGGAVAGRRRLQHWTAEHGGIGNYKQTRNCLDGLDGSSTLSPWLASGALSVREVAAAIDRHEREFGANESTHWLLLELLWREFFHWRALADDVALFRLGGAGGRLHRCTFEPRNFARWSKGDTNVPLVNALMRQLLATGWMSNRGRQIAASYLVNELGLDWRFGAAFFEKHLIDYDVGSNFGNWQYLAGVGADPRGGRHFNLAKQAEQFDPTQRFTRKWDGFQPQQPEFVTDGADWPIDPR